MAARMTRLGKAPKGEQVRISDMSLKMALVIGRHLPLASGWCFCMPRRIDLTAWAENTDGLLGACNGRKCWTAARYSMMVL